MSRFTDLDVFTYPTLRELYDVPLLTAFPANVHHDTAPFQSLGLRLLKKQAEAHYFSATGETLDATTTISAGHKHNAWSTVLRWRGLGSWTIQGGKDDDVKEGFYVNTTSRNFQWTSFVVPLDAAGTGLPERRIIPYYRLSNPAPGSSTPGTLTVQSTLYRDNSGSLASVATVPPLYVTSTSSVTFSNVWLEGPPLDLTVADVVTASGLLFWRLEAGVSAGDAAVFEVRWGFLEGGA